MKIDKILLDHGSGGKMSHNLTADIMLPVFNNPILSQLNDGAIFNLGEKRFAFSTDSYVVDPIFFPGGNIGDLAINGTVNDIAMCGATPLYLSAGLIIEEGFPVSDLKIIIKGMGAAADLAGVKVVTGDTKVVPKGAADKIFINTTGIGIVHSEADIRESNIKVGDKIFVSGNIATHGMAIMSVREGLEFETDIKSDTQNLNHLIKDLLDEFGNKIHFLRDPTRGGIGTTLSEISQKQKWGIDIYQGKLPIEKQVASACEILGLDPLYVANEGVMICIVDAEIEDAFLLKLKKDSKGKDAKQIGEITDEHKGKVVIKSEIGGKRVVNMLIGEQLPRIC